MADTYLSPRTAFGSHAPRHDQIGAWTLSERAAGPCASVTARDGQIDAVTQRIRDLTGHPVGHGSFVTTAGYRVMGTAAGQWFVQSDHPELLAELHTRFDTTASMTEQSDAWVGFTLGGPQINSVLERLVMMDLTSMQDGQLQRGLLEHMNIFLLCHQNRGQYEIMVARSYAQSLYHAVHTTMTSVASLRA